MFAQPFPWCKRNGYPFTQQHGAPFVPQGTVAPLRNKIHCRRNTRRAEQGHAKVGILLTRAQFKMPQHGQRKIWEETGRIINRGTNPLQTGIGHVIGIRIIVGVAFIIGHFARRHGELGTPVVRTLFSHTVGQHVATEHVEVVLFVPVTPPHVKCTIDRCYQEIGLQMCHII